MNTEELNLPRQAGMTAMVAESYPGIGPGQTVRNAFTLAWRNVTQLRHSPEKLIDTTLMPILFLMLFLYVFGGALAGSTHAYLQVLLPGLVAQMAMFATMGLGTALNEDIHKGVFDRLRSMPIARSAPLIGAVLGETVKFGVVMSVLTGFGSLLGFRFHASPLSVLAGYALAYVFYLAVCWLSVLVGMFAPSPETVQGLSFIFVFPLTFGSNIFVADTHTMPGWLQSWIKVNPVTQLTESLRALMLGHPAGNHPLYVLAWAAGIVVVAFPTALWLYNRKA
jgi:oleandomycin transport system permease protein